MTTVATLRIEASGVMDNPPKKPHSFLYGTAQNYLGSLFAVITGAALVACGRAVLSYPFLRIFVPIIGVYLVLYGSYLSYQSHRVRPRKLDEQRPLAFRMLQEECEFLHRSYRDLGFTDPANTKLPLNPASWPDFSAERPWSYTDVKLCCLHSHFILFSAVARSAFNEMGWNDYVELFNLDGKCVLMVDLLVALERFQRLLESKV